MASPTRERVLDAALALIQQHGFGGTTVTAIEELAGLSPGSGSFYRHFRSKEEVFREVFERELERAQQFRQELERGPVGDPREELTRRFRQRLDYMGQIGPLINLLAREHGRFPDLTEKVGAALVHQDIEDEAAQLLHDLDAEPGHIDPRGVLAVVLSALTGYHLTQ
ncbi:MAG: TetR/AcrR family transcriptional regulator, partial [Streptosporangiaceae bacterium]